MVGKKGNTKLSEITKTEKTTEKNPLIFRCRFFLLPNFPVAISSVAVFSVALFSVAVFAVNLFYMYA